MQYLKIVQIDTVAGWKDIYFWPCNSKGSITPQQRAELLRITNQLANVQLPTRTNYRIVVRRVPATTDLDQLLTKVNKMQLNTQSIKEQLITSYLDWFNNYLSVAVWAEHHNMQPADAQAVIDIGRTLHEREAAKQQRLKISRGEA